MLESRLAESISVTPGNPASFLRSMNTKPSVRSTARPILVLLFSCVVVCAASAVHAGMTGRDLVQLSLPGVPAVMVPADLDGDGLEDLVVVVVYNEWGTVTSFEQAQFDEVEGLVEVMNVVSAVIDRRELWVYPGLAGGSGFGPPLPALDLDTSIRALQAMPSPSGGREEVLIALTDNGLAAIRLDRAQGVLTFRPLAELATRFARDGQFYTDLQFLHDLDADGRRDALVPVESGWAIVPGTPSGFAAERAAIIPAPGPPEAADTMEEADAEEAEKRKKKRNRKRESESAEAEAAAEPQLQNLPEVRDLNGDHLLELVIIEGEHDFDSVRPRTVLYRNRGDFHFDPPSVLVAPLHSASPRGGGEPGDAEAGVSDRQELEAPKGEPQEAEAEEENGERIVYVGDLDGDGQAVVVVRRELDRWDEDPTLRQEIRSVKEPLFAYRLYALAEDLTLGSQAQAFEALGYNFEGAQADEDDGVDFRLPGGFQDLDGDGRLDLVSITLDFSILPLLTRVLVTRSMKVQMNFQRTCQTSEGDFQAVQGVDLSGQFKINLRKSRIRHLSQFAGDFNGDGRADFVQLGRGRKVTVHHGQIGCRYASEGDETIVLERKPKHLGLLRILDLNNDALADLYVVHPLEKPHKDRSTPVRVDIYLSRVP